jgi:uncharacterized protein YndB with AHSA1/START domain
VVVADELPPNVGGENGFAVTRVFDAPIERVWSEWTEPEAFADWYGGPGCEVPLESMAMDVRPGGKWSCVMYAPPHRPEIHWRGEYLEVEEPNRLVFTVTDAPEELYDLCIVELTDLGDGRTEMRFEQQGTMSPEGYEAAKSGWGGFFDRIDERLAAD